jgi:hypothetical protein
VVAGIRYLPGPKSSAELRLLRTLQFSSSGNFQIKSRADLSYAYNIIRNLIARAGIYWELSQPSVGDDITRYGAGLGARYMVLENLDVDVALDYQDRITDRPGYENNQFIGSVGLTLYFR